MHSKVVPGDLLWVPLCLVQCRLISRMQGAERGCAICRDKDKVFDVAKNPLLEREPWDSKHFLVHSGWLCVLRAVRPVHLNLQMAPRSPQKLPWQGSCKLMWGPLLCQLGSEIDGKWGYYYLYGSVHM